MDLRKLLVMQKELDEVIFKNAGITEYPRKKILLALLTELGELSNEVKSFKYWKKNIETDRERILDEFADCLHFALSLENDKGEVSNIEFDILDETFKELNEELEKLKLVGIGTDLNDEFRTTFKAICDEDDILFAVLVLGNSLGISLNEMQAAYIKKNRINYERQENGY